MADLTQRPRVFLDVQSGPEHFGRIIIELFADKAPKTCENFRTICTSTFTPSSATKPLTYKLSPFHRIIDEFMIQGGDITAGDGTGGTSIYGGEFEDENIGWREVDKEGLVCMANRGKSTNSSQFFITLAPCPHLNTKHTVFGHVVSGLDILHRMAKVPVDSKDRPLTEIIISHCGELERRKKAPIPPSQHQTSTRGRRHPTRSPSSSRSPSPHGHHNKTALPSSRPPRRKSDFALDETRRGRTLTRSPSPHALSPSPPRKRRKRSLPPSRSHSRHSRSPHLRRRHTKSRSRSLRREKRGRDEGRGRREADATNARYNGRHDGHERGFRSAGYWDRDDERDGFNGHGGDGRLDDPGDLGGNVKFKGRGSMKYREKKW